MGRRELNSKFPSVTRGRSGRTLGIALHHKPPGSNLAHTCVCAMFPQSCSLTIETEQTNEIKPDTTGMIHIIPVVPGI